MTYELWYIHWHDGTFSPIWIPEPAPFAPDGGPITNAVDAIMAEILDHNPRLAASERKGPQDLDRVERIRGGIPERDYGAF